MCVCNNIHELDKILKMERNVWIIVHFIQINLINFNNCNGATCWWRHFWHVQTLTKCIASRRLYSHHTNSPNRSGCLYRPIVSYHFNNQNLVLIPNPLIRCQHYDLSNFYILKQIKSYVHNFSKFHEFKWCFGELERYP